MRIEALNAAQRIFAWARATDFRGHDPHDLLEAPLFKSPLFRAVARQKFPAIAITQIGRRSRRDLHSLLRVPKQANSKSDALFLQGILKLRSQIDSDWEPLALALIERILAAQNAGGWGYPFAWQSRTHFIPKHAPTVVATAFCAHALLDAYPYFPSDLIAHSVSRAVSFVQLDLPRAESERGLAFGYAPNDPQIIFNASLLGASLLMRWGYYQGDEEMTSTAQRCADFVISYQEPTGRFAYGLEPTQTWCDAFHTAYVLEALRTIGHLNESPRTLIAAERGYQYFLNRFIGPRGEVAYFDKGSSEKERGPYDAHAAATAILLMKRFGADERASQAAKYALASLQLESGAFAYQRQGSKLNPNTYIRWSNAWMFRALCAMAAPD